MDFPDAAQLRPVLRPLLKAMEDYEMKQGTTTSTYDIPEAEQVVNPVEDNDLVQIGYKPELEVPRWHTLRHGSDS